MQLDLQVAAVAAVDRRTVAIGQQFQVLFQSRLLPAASGFDTGVPFYWGYMALQNYLTWIAFYPASDWGRFFAVMYSTQDGGICASRGMGTVDNRTTAAQIMRYWVTSDATGAVRYTWFRNYTGIISAYLAGQLDAPVAHVVNPSGATGMLVITYSMRLCSNGTSCAPGAPGQLGILQIWTSTSDLSANLVASLSSGVPRSARSFVADHTGRLVASSHGVPWVMVNRKIQYLMMDNESCGDHTMASIGRGLLGAGLQGQEVSMHRTRTHIVSSRNIAIGTAGTLWTVYYAVPTDSAYGELYRTVGICAGISAALAALAATVSWAVQHVFLTKPLGLAVSTINTLARLNMAGIAEATLSLGAAGAARPREELARGSEELARLARRRSSAPLVGNFLNEVTGVLRAAEKMVHSLYCVGRYVSMDLATWVISQGVLASPLQPRDVSVLFCDIEGSTAMIDRCRTQQIMAEFAELLNEILTDLANTARQFDGYIDKFIGDGTPSPQRPGACPDQSSPVAEVMVVFNAPCECPEHQSRACEAANAMQHCVNKLRILWEAQGKYRDFGCPRVRVTVASGPVLVGDIGAFGTLVNYTAIGEVVCIAARLQEVAKLVRPPRGVLVTGETRWQEPSSATRAA
eukprot:m51a1_g13647 hypothetical protein (633) ;mRNA; r:11-1958